MEDRRSFFKGIGFAGLGAVAATYLAGGATEAEAQQIPMVTPNFMGSDRPEQILTAALIAEDLATTFYYNGLIGGVIQDPALAGPGGSATNVTASGNLGNVNYLQAALSAEIQHATLLRTLLGLGSDPSVDPAQTFYFPKGSFDTLSAFTGLLDALENAFIGAYTLAVRSFAHMGSITSKGPAVFGYKGKAFSASEFEYFAEVAATIQGVESEHRVLGRVISNTNPANNLYYEQTDGLTSVYNGDKSAVVALTPFLSMSTGPSYSFATAIANAATVAIPGMGSLPAY